LGAKTGLIRTDTLETSEIGRYAEDRISEDLSLDHVLPSQIRQLFRRARNAALATDFE